MQFLTSNANIFLIHANDITNNNLGPCVEKIHQQIVQSNNTFSYIFIDGGFPFRWKQDIQNRMTWLHNRLDSEFIVHDLILPPAIFQEMSDKNATGDMLRAVKGNSYVKQD